MKHLNLSSLDTTYHFDGKKMGHRRKIGSLIRFKLILRFSGWPDTGGAHRAFETSPFAPVLARPSSSTIHRPKRRSTVVGHSRWNLITIIRPLRFGFPDPTKLTIRMERSSQGGFDISAAESQTSRSFRTNSHREAMLPLTISRSR